jgi:hypothetical protein
MSSIFFCVRFQRGAVGSSCGVSNIVLRSAVFTDRVRQRARKWFWLQHCHERKFAITNQLNREREDVCEWRSMRE